MKSLKLSLGLLLMVSVCPQPALSQAPDLADVQINPEVLMQSLDANLPDIYSRIAQAVSKNIDFLELSYSEPSDEMDQSGWIAKYAWDYERLNGEASTDNNRLTTDDLFFKFEIDGTYAQHNTTNLGDMTTLSLAYQRRKADLGEIRLDNQSLEYRNCQLEVANSLDPDNPPESEAEIQAIENAAFACLFDHEIDRLIDSEDDYKVSAWELHANLESNQDFTERQETFGLSGIYAQGRLPSFRISIDTVDAGNNSARKAITDELEFERVTAEVAYDTPLFNIGGHTLRFSASYRYFAELSAPESIEAADMDKFDYYSLSLRLPSGALPWFDTEDYNIVLSYVDGQLPFDLAPVEGIQLGFSTNLESLARLISK